MKNTTKTLISLFFIIIFSSASTLAQVRKWQPDRFYLELGPLNGVNDLYDYSPYGYNKTNLQYGRNIGMMQPTGLTSALVVGNSRYQLKGRVMFASGDRSIADWMQDYCSAGWRTKEMWHLTSMSAWLISKWS